MFNFLKNVSLLCAFYLFSSQITLAEAQSKNGDSVMVEASITSKDGYKLNFELKNLSPRPLRFYRSMLSSRSINMIIVKDGPGGTKLKGLAVLDFPTSEKIKLETGKVFHQSIDLEELYPSLLAELEKGNLILYWNVVINTIDHKEIIKRFGGYVLIEKIVVTN